MLIPGDPNGEKDTIVEIRAGVGGDEAAIFAERHSSRYERFARNVVGETEVLSENHLLRRAASTVSSKVTGDKVYSVVV